MNALFWSSIFFTPKPPMNLGLVIVDQETVGFLEELGLDLQEKNIMHVSIGLMIFLGTKKVDMA